MANEAGRPLAEGFLRRQLAEGDRPFLARRGIYDLLGASPREPSGLVHPLRVPGYAFHYRNNPAADPGNVDVTLEFPERRAAETKPAPAPGADVSPATAARARADAPPFPGPLPEPSVRFADPPSGTAFPRPAAAPDRGGSAPGTDRTVEAAPSARPPVPAAGVSSFSIPGATQAQVRFPLSAHPGAGPKPDPKGPRPAAAAEKPAPAAGATMGRPPAPAAFAVPATVPMSSLTLSATPAARRGPMAVPASGSPAAFPGAPDAVPGPGPARIAGMPALETVLDARTGARAATLSALSAARPEAGPFAHAASPRSRDAGREDESGKAPEPAARRAPVAAPPVVVVSQQAPPQRAATTPAFWERSYLSRLRLRRGR